MSSAHTALRELVASLARAERALEAGDLARAASAVEEALAIDPRNVQAADLQQRIARRRTSAIPERTVGGPRAADPPPTPRAAARHPRRAWPAPQRAPRPTVGAAAWSAFEQRIRERRATKALEEAQAALARRDRLGALAALGELEAVAAGHPQTYTLRQALEQLEDRPPPAATATAFPAGEAVLWPAAAPASTASAAAGSGPAARVARVPPAPAPPARPEPLPEPLPAPLATPLPRNRARPATLALTVVAAAALTAAAVAGLWPELSRYETPGPRLPALSAQPPQPVIADPEPLASTFDPAAHGPTIVAPELPRAEATGGTAPPDAAPLGRAIPDATSAPPAPVPSSPSALARGEPRPAGPPGPPSAALIHRETPAAAPPSVADSASRLPEAAARVPDIAPTRPSSDLGRLNAGSVAAAPALAPAARSIEPPRAEAAVRHVLNRFVQSYSALDAQAAQQVWPSVDRRALGRAFDQLQAQTITFSTCDVSTDDRGAQAECTGTASWVPKVGDRSPRDERRTWRFDLARRNDHWLIEHVEVRR